MSGRVLVRCGPEVGDTIRHARFLPALAARAASVTVRAPSDLLPLLATVDAPLVLQPSGHGRSDAADDEAFDERVDIAELAALLRVCPDASAGPGPYLRAPLAPARRRDRTTVGVVWRGGDGPAAGCPSPCALQALADVPGVRLIAFDASPTPEDRAAWSGDWEPTATVSELAAAIAGCDLVISVDAPAAHLAGALAVPVWTLLAHDAGARWTADRDRSAWYPTMRLFRQPATGAWDAVVGRLKAALWTAATWPALAARL